MPKERSDNRRRSREIYNEHNGQITNREIAHILDCSEKSISGWKCKDNWTGKERSTPNKNKRSTPEGRKRGGQPGNKNATGPPGNKNAEKHGFFTKWLPEETMAILDDMSKDPLDLLWDNIQLQYAAIIRAQKLMYVKDQKDKTKEMIVVGEKWEIQQAWDKHETFMSAQSRSMKTLQSMIRDYEDLLSKRSGPASEEQRARIDHMKAQTKKLETADVDVEDKKLSKVDQILEEMQEDAKRKAS